MKNQPFTYSWSILLDSQLNRNALCPETGPLELPPARASQGRGQWKSKRKRTNWKSDGLEIPTPPASNCKKKGTKRQDRQGLEATGAHGGTTEANLGSRGGKPPTACAVCPCEQSSLLAMRDLSSAAPSQASLECPQLHPFPENSTARSLPFQQKDLLPSSECSSQHPGPALSVENSFLLFFFLFFYFFFPLKRKTETKQYYRIIYQHEKEVGIFSVHTDDKNHSEAPKAGGSQAPSFRKCMDYTQNQRGCNVRISLLSRCHKPLNNSTWCSRGLLLIHGFLNSWQSHQ